MFCPICGTENDNKAKFCKQCGAALQPAASGAQPQPSSPKVNPSQERNHIAEPNRMHAEAHQTQNSVAKNQLNEAAAKVKALPKNLLFGGIAAIVVIILLFMFASSNAKTINLDQYLTIKGSGYNGYGSADATIDWDAIKERYGKKISIKKKKSGSGLSLDDLYGYTDPIDVLSNCVSVSFKPSKGLSNGDEVSYTWDIEEDVLNKFVDCKLKYKDGTQKIDGLEEVGQFDPFHDITVEYDGIAPNGEAYFNYNGSELSSYDFSADKTRGLRNGDVITLTLNLNESRIRDLAESYGRVPSTTEKQYTVEGLGSYLESLSQVDDASLQAMQQQAADVFNAHVASSWGADTEHLLNFTYIGDYLQTAKSDAIWGDQNRLYLVYKMQVQDIYSSDSGSYNGITTVYWYIYFSDLRVDGNGSLIFDVTKYQTPSDKVNVNPDTINYHWWYYGYSTLDELYRTQITAMLDAYNHEDNVDESSAPNETLPETAAAPASGDVQETISLE